jgi:hypothetical protein
MEGGVLSTTTSLRFLIDCPAPSKAAISRVALPSADRHTRAILDAACDGYCARHHLPIRW